MSITDKRLTATHEQAIRARLAVATEGPWAAWTDQDGTRHMGGMLMVGVAAGVIPDGETWVEGADVNNPVAHTYTPEDRELIAHAPTDLAALLAELDLLRGKIAAADIPVRRTWTNLDAIPSNVGRITDKVGDHAEPQTIKGQRKWFFTAEPFDGVRVSPDAGPFTEVLEDE